MKYVLKPALTLFLVAGIVIALVSYFHSRTLAPVELQKQKTQEAARKTVLPADMYNELAVEKTGSIISVYEGLTGGKLAGYVVSLSPKGYSGNIDLMVGFALPDEKISGMRVLRHTETPGLGALAVKENFYRRFDNKALAPLNVIRIPPPGDNDIQAITSATITTRAITNAVNEAIHWYLGQKTEDECIEADYVTSPTIHNGHGGDME